MTRYQQTKPKKFVYKDAPSGYINIKKWVPPFVPVKNGFGFIGVLAEDSKTGQLQCHECGKWFEQLPTHYTKKHKMNGVQYRKKFGLLSGTALKSKRLRLIQSKVMSDFRKTGNRKFLRKFKTNNVESANRKGKPKAKESQNKYGVCDLQIITKIIDLSRRLGKTPTLVDIKNEYGGGLISIMYNRYGSYIKYCKNYLKMEPNFSSHNRKYSTKKSWREHLLEVGRQSLAKGNSLTIKGLFPDTNEDRYIYKYFKSFGDYKKQLIKLK